MAHEATVVKELKNSIFWITLNRPDVLNAIDMVMGKELSEALRAAESERSARLVVLTGSGRAFTVGEDLNENRKVYTEGKGLDLESTLRNKYNPIILRIRKLSKPVLAAVNGVTAGAGLGIALACDIRVAAESAVFHMAFNRVGLVPDSGTAFWLVKSLGLSKASELCMLGEPVKSKEALELGLISKVYPDESFRAEVESLASKLAKGPSKALYLTKRALNKALFSNLEEMLDYEAYLQGIAGRTKDHAEGVRAFFEKREPQFSGE